MKLQLFNGGLQTRLEPHLIEADAAVEYENIDNESGALKPIKDKANANVAVNPYYHNFKDEWISFVEPIEFAELHNKLYYGGIKPKKYNGTITDNLGVVKPSTKPNVEVVEIAKPTGMTVTLEAANFHYTLENSIGTGNLPAGVYNYRYIAYNENGNALASYDDTFTRTGTGASRVRSNTTDLNEINTLVLNNGFTKVYREYLGIYREMATFPSQNYYTNPLVVTDSALNISSNASAPVVSTVSLAPSTVKQYNLVNNISGYRSAEYNTYSGLVGSLVLHVYQIRVDSFTGIESGSQLYRQYLGVPRLIGTAVDGGYLLDYIEDVSSNPTYSGDSALLAGIYQYAVTYYNSLDGTESQPSEFTKELIVESGYTNLSVIPSSTDSQIDKKKIYRIGGNLTAFTEVIELNNSTTTYIDSASDESLTGLLLDSILNHEAPINLRYLLAVKGELLGVVGSKVYFTRGIGNPNYWPEDYYFDFPEDVTGIGLTANGVLVFTKYQTHILVGSSSTTYSVHLLSGDQGCLANESIVAYGGRLLWASTDGICSSAGGAVEVITKSKLGKILVTPIGAAIHDEVYYLHQSDGKTLAVDFRHKGIFKQLDFGITGISKYKDILYGYLSGSLYKLHSSSTSLNITYLSPVFTEGSFTEVKVYNNIYIRSSGSYTLEVFIDGVSVITKLVSVNGTQDIAVPQEKQRGYSIQFKITGLGTVYELEYKAVGRKNGR